MGIGTALVTASAAQAATITQLNLTSSVSDHKSVTTQGGTVSAGNANNNCITYSIADASTGSGNGGNRRYTSTTLSSNESLTGHGYGSGGSCPNGDTVVTDSSKKSAQSAVGIKPNNAAVAVDDGVPFNLAVVKHYNNSITSSSTTSRFFTGNLNISMGGFDGNPVLTFPWQLWETSNAANPCPGGDKGDCDDEISFTSQIGDKVLKKNGLSYRLVIGGFIPTSDTVCPSTPSGTPVNDFWTKESAVTTACLYASVVQIRNLTVSKVTAGTNTPTNQPFAFSSTGALSGSPWKDGAKSVTPTVVGTPVEAFSNELLRGDTVTIKETPVTDPRWALTTMACTEIGTNGNLQALTGASYANGIITLDKIGAPENTSKPDITCTFTNTFTAGNLTIEKQLDDPAKGLAKAGKLYTGTYSCGPGFSGTFSLQANASNDATTKTTISGIPVGRDCTVLETMPTGDLANGSFAWGTPTFSGNSSNSNTVTIASGADSKVIITNHIVQNKGTFTVTKTVNGPAGGFINTGRDFEVGYTCTLGSPAVQVAKDTLKIKKDASSTSSPIPTGASCVLTESLAAAQGDFADGSYEWVGTSGTFAPAGPITIGANNTNVGVALTNTFKRNYGQLTITKKVEGPAGAFTGTNMDFTGTYTCAGVARDFTVKNGGTFTSPANTIPAGTSCFVAEKAPVGGLLNASYEWAAATYAPSNATVTVPNTGSATVAITNKIVQNSGKFSIAKTVTGPEGDNGYTGTSGRTFGVDYKCTLANGADISGSLEATTTGVKESPSIPAGYSCVLSEPNLVTQSGDFVDGSYEWLAPTAASFTPGNTVTIGSNTIATVVLNNKYTRNFGSLNLKKVIDGDGYIGAGAKFEVKYNCGGNYTGTRLLTAGDAGVTIENLPANALCTLEETPPAVNLLSPAFKWGTATWDPADGKIVIKKNGTVSATVTNHTVAITGAVQVVKAVVGGGVNAGVIFDLTVTCGDIYSGTFSNLAGVAGTTPQLPVGTSCTVSEADRPTGSGVFVDDSYAWAAKPEAQTVKIEGEGQLVTVTVTNTTQRVYGSLQVKKTLNDPDGVYVGSAFTGKWSCTYADAAAGSGVWSATAGQAAKIVGSDILLGSTCTVTEDPLTAPPATDTSYSWGLPVLSPQGGVVVVSAANPSPEVSITNTINRSTGLFSVTKGVNGPMEGFPEGTQFPFTWSCEKSTWAGANGSFTLTNGQSWDGPGAGTAIPAGASCTVTEGSFPTSNPSYTWDSVTFAATGEGANGTQIGNGFTFTVPASTADAPKPVHVGATNTISRKFGSITVAKTVDAGYSSESGYKFSIGLNCGANGTFTTEVAGGATATITGIPLGSECEVSEGTRNGGLVDGSFTWDTPTFSPKTLTMDQTATPVAVTVHNPTKRVYGSLLISKVLTGASSVVDSARDYKGTWQCVYGSDQPKTGTWSVKAGATMEPITGILVGSSCTIAKEDPLAAPSADPSYVWVDPVFSAASTVKADSAAKLSVTNEVKRNTGSIVVTKKLSGATEGLKAEQKFTMTYSCSAAGVEGTMNGQLAISPDVETTLLDNVPFGWNCVVNEASPTADQLKDASFSWGAVTGAPTTVVLATGNNPAKVTVTNNIVRNLGAVKIQKILTGPTGIVPSDKEYSGTFSCIYDGNVIKTGNWSTTAGSAAIELAKDLPLTTSCTATEDELGAPSNDPSYSWDAAKFSIATVGAGESAVIDVTNTLVRNLGSFKVHKQITGSAAELAGYIGGDAKNFTVNYQCSVPGQEGIPAISGSTQVANGEKENLATNNIPFGWNCTFTESTPHQDQLKDASFAWGPAKITPASATLGETTSTVTVSVENPITRIKGAVKVSKVLNGPDNAGAVDSNREYTGQWTCTYGEGNSAVIEKGTWSAKAGAAAVNVSEGVLLNSSCVITEDELTAPVPNDPSFRWVSAVASNDTVTVGQPANLVMTNTFTRDSGSFTVTKKIDGAGYTSTDNPAFTVNYNCGIGFTGTLNLAKDETATIDSIPAQRECELTEAMPEGNLEAAYKWIPGTWSANVVNGKITVDRDAPTAAIITNHTEKIFGSISVVKALAGAGGVAQGKEFTVDITCTDEYSGRLTMVANAAPKTTGQIAVGSSCTVTEVPPTGGLVDDSFGWDGTPEPQIVKVTAENQVVPVSVTNTTERRYGSLSVAKVLMDPDKVYQGGEFTGTWQCTYGQGETAVVKNGKWSVAAGAGTKVVGTDILLGSSCNIAEDKLTDHPSEDTSYVWAPSYSPGQDVVLSTLEANRNITVTNTITRLTGSFGVVKSLAGNGVESGVKPDTSFSFDYKCTGPGWAGADGSFTLKAGLDGWNPAETIPAGASCTVTENDNPDTTGPAYTWDGVSFAVTGAAGVPVTTDRSVTFIIPAPVDGKVQTIGINATNNISKKFGDVVVSKKLAGATQGYDGKRTFDVVLSCENAAAQTLTVSAVEGSNSASVKLPLGTKCTVAESALGANEGLVDTSFAWTGADISNGTFTVSSQTTAISVDVTNTIGRVTGSVDVTKKLTGPADVVDPTRIYTGSWSCTYKEEPAVTGKWSLAKDATSVPVTGILLNSDCVVSEDEVTAPSVDPSYRWSVATFEDASVTTADTTAHLVVTNNLVRDTGAIKVAKAVIGEVGGFTGGSNPVFDIGYSCSVEGVETALTGSAKVANGETVTLPGAIPFGWTCAISEVQPTGSLSDDSFAWERPKVEQPTVVLSAETPTATVQVENPIKRVYGSIAVEKVVTGPAAGKVPADREFTGEMVCTYGSDQPVTKAWTATTATPQKIDGILVGSNCAITETVPTAGPVQDDPSMVWLPVKLPTDIQVTGSETPATATVTNPTEQLFGAFAITKTVTGATNGVAADAQYSFNWMCTSAGFTSPLSGTASIANGEVWQLPSMVLIPRGSSCTVVEAPEGRPDTIDGAYTWDPVKFAVTGATGTEQGASTTFTVPTDDTKVLVVAANPITRSYGEFAVTKSSNPVSGTQLKVGQSVTYTLTVVNTSEISVHDVVLTDDLASVLGAAALVGSSQQSQGAATITGQVLKWNAGTLAAGATQTLSYTVKVNAGSENKTLTNMVLGTGDVPPTSCAASIPSEGSSVPTGTTASNQAPCGTTHTVAPPVVPPVVPPAAPELPLANTGISGLWSLGLGALLLTGGAALMLGNRRRREEIQ